LDKNLSQQNALEQDTSVASSSQARSSCWTSLLNWVLYLGFAFFGLSGWVRMGYAIQNWYWLIFSGIQPGPLYMIVSGALWGLVGFAALAWMIFRRQWYRLVGLGAALFFAFTYWIDRLFIATGPGSSSNTPFAALMTILLLVYVALVLRPMSELRTLLYN